MAIFLGLKLVFCQGGTPDILGTARQVLNDWNHQKIPYFSTPPTIHPSSIPTTQGGSAVPGAESVGQAQILQEFTPAFQIDGLFGMADQGAFDPDVEESMVIEDEQTGKDVFMEVEAEG